MSSAVASSAVVELAADAAGCALMGVSGGVASAESVDYVQHKQQFQLHSMLTEQRHPNTNNMSQTISKDAAVRHAHTGGQGEIRKKQARSGATHMGVVCGAFAESG